MPEKVDIEFYFDSGLYHDAREEAWPVRFVACRECGMAIARVIHPDYVPAERCEPDRCLECTFDLEAP